MCANAFGLPIRSCSMGCMIPTKINSVTPTPGKRSNVLDFKRGAGYRLIGGLTGVIIPRL